MNKKNKTTQIIAIIALLGIVLSIVSTGIIFIMSSRSNNNEEVRPLTQEELEELNRLIESQSGSESIVEDNIEIDDFNTNNEK